MLKRVCCAWLILVACSAPAMANDGDGHHPGDGFMFGFGVLSGALVSAGQGMTEWLTGFELVSAYSRGPLRVDGRFGAMSAEDLTFHLGVGASWVPLSGAWSPFIGAGLLLMTFEHPSEHGAGAVVARSSSDIGLGIELRAGVEVFRSASARLIIQGSCRLPFFTRDAPDGTDGETEYPLLPAGRLVVLW